MIPGFCQKYESYAKIALSFRYHNVRTEASYVRPATGDSAARDSGKRVIRRDVIWGYG